MAGTSFPRAQRPISRPLLLIGWFQTTWRILHLQHRRDRSCKYQFHSCIETPVHPYPARIPSCRSAKRLQGANGSAAFTKLVSHGRRDEMRIEPCEERYMG